MQGVSAKTMKQHCSVCKADFDMEIIKQGSSENVLWLPPQAVNEFGNRTFVVIQTPDGERVRDVEVGLQTDQFSAGLQSAVNLRQCRVEFGPFQVFEKVAGEYHVQILILEDAQIRA